jgi:hypothetical protein
MEDAIARAAALYNADQSRPCMILFPREDDDPRYGDCGPKAVCKASWLYGDSKVSSVRTARALAVRTLKGPLTRSQARLIDAYESEAHPQGYHLWSLYDPGATAQQQLLWTADRWGDHWMKRRLHWLQREAYWGWGKGTPLPASTPPSEAPGWDAFIQELALTEGEISRQYEDPNHPRKARDPSVYFTPALLVAVFGLVGKGGRLRLHIKPLEWLTRHGVPGISNLGGCAVVLHSAEVQHYVLIEIRVRPSRHMMTPRTFDDYLSTELMTD